MKKVLILALISILLFILDNVLMPFLSIREIYPNLLFVFIICYSMVNGKWEGLWLGVFAGLLQDLYFTNGFWINAFVNMIMCVAAGFIGDSIFKEKKLIPVLSCFALSILKGFILMLILYIAGTYINPVNIVFTGFYNMIVCIIVYKKVYKFCQKYYMQRRWKF